MLNTLTDSSAKDAFRYTTSFGPMGAGAMAAVMPMAISTGVALLQAPQLLMGSTLAGAVAGYYAGNQGDQWWMDAAKGAAGAYAVGFVLGRQT